jgi:hypothetical protein
MDARNGSRLPCGRSAGCSPLDTGKCDLGTGVGGNDLSRIGSRSLEAEARRTACRRSRSVAQRHLSPTPKSAVASSAGNAMAGNAIAHHSYVRLFAAPGVRVGSAGFTFERAVDRSQTRFAFRLPPSSSSVLTIALSVASNLRCRNAGRYKTMRCAEYICRWGAGIASWSRLGPSRLVGGDRFRCVVHSHGSKNGCTPLGDRGGG